eukprot:Anaeramoba_ignava/c21700_g2_i1.p2 GENE.c21700_g2_i1~~c21700_g2_i1.p2  ORF type:complete len:502 (+),score=165.59 c21700_g2_i1:2169-3674(+)
MKVKFQFFKKYMILSRFSKRKLKKKEILCLLFHAIEVVWMINFEPLKTLLSEDILQDPKDPKAQEVIKRLGKIYWPGIPDLKFSFLFQEGLNKWMKCPTDHLCYLNNENEKKPDLVCFGCGKRMDKDLINELANNSKNENQKNIMYELAYEYLVWHEENGEYQEDQELLAKGLRNLSPISFVLIRIITNSVILCMSILSENFVNNFFVLLEIENQANQEHFIEFLQRKLVNDFNFLRQILDLSSYDDALRYLHSFLILMEKVQKRDGIEKVQERDEIEKEFEEMVNQKKFKIRQNIELQENNPSKKWETKTLFWPLIQYEKITYPKFIFSLEQYLMKKEGFPFINFVVEHWDMLSILHLFAGFWNFASYIFDQINTEISYKKAKETKISTLINQEKNQKKKDLLNQWYNDFELFWNIARRDVKKLLNYSGTKKKDPINIKKMDKNLEVAFCLFGMKNLFISIQDLITYSVSIHNNLIQKFTNEKGDSSVMIESKKIGRNKN